MLPSGDLLNFCNTGNNHLPLAILISLHGWLERDKVSLGAYFPSGCDLVVCEGGLSGIKCR